MTIKLVVQLLGGVGIFLYSIKLISDSLQRVAGDRLRHLVGMLTRTPLLVVLIGTLVTMLIQSSSATTVMTVSFVDAGLMKLTQAIGVIMGANIGTTVTGQILAIRIKDYVYIFLLVGVLLSFFCKKPRWRHVGNGLIGFGLLFVGMQTMESAMAFLRDRQDLFLAFSRSPLMGVAAGALLTLLVQSSSATVGLTIALGTQGLLPLDAAIPIVLGDNIGTCITAVLASIGTTRAAQQACTAHVLFNVIGVCIFLPLMPLYIGLIAATSQSIGHQIANAHTLFNVCNTLLFLPFVRPFAALIRFLLPDRKAEAGAVADTLYLDPRLIEVTPVMAVEAVRNQCAFMGDLLRTQLDEVERMVFENNAAAKKAVISLENRLDAVLQAMERYSEAVLNTHVSDDAAHRLHALLVCAGDLERIGDICMRLVGYDEHRQELGRSLSSRSMADLRDLFLEARSCVDRAVEGIRTADTDGLAALQDEAKAAAQDVRDKEGRMREQYMERINSRTGYGETGLLYIEIIGDIERMAYRSWKITRAMAASAAPE